MKTYVKTINPVLIDPPTSKYAHVYFTCPVIIFNDALPRKTDPTYIGVVQCVLLAEYKDDNGKFTEYKRFPCEYKRSTWNNIWTGIDASQMDSYKPGKMIQEIELSNSNYWGLTSEDLEVVTE